MELPKVEELTMMPRWLGAIFYPLGKPVRAVDTVVNGKCVVEHLATPHHESLEICRQWLIYYLSAPLWQMNPGNRGVLEGLIARARVIPTTEALESEGWEQLTSVIYDCVDLGIDPF